MNISAGAYNNPEISAKLITSLMDTLLKPVPQYAEISVLGDAVKKVVRIRDELPRLEPVVSFDPMFPNHVANLLGMRVMLQDIDYPKMQVSAEFARIQSPALVNKTNQWMREFFGMEHPVYRQGDILVMSETTFRQLRNSLHQ